MFDDSDHIRFGQITVDQMLDYQTSALLKNKRTAKKLKTNANIWRNTRYNSCHSGHSTRLILATSPIADIDVPQFHSSTEQDAP